MKLDPNPLQPGGEFELLPARMCGCPDNGTNPDVGWKAVVLSYKGFDGSRYRYNVKAYPPGAKSGYRRWWVFKEQLVRPLDTSQDIVTDDLSILM